MSEKFTESMQTCRKILNRKTPAKRDQVLTALNKLENESPVYCPLQGSNSYQRWVSY